MSVAQQLDDWPGWPDPPVPVRGCADCLRLDEKRQDAETAGNGAAATDARVLLRRHLDADHGSADANPS